MNDIASKTERSQSRGEELANSISHGIGLAVVLFVAVPVLLTTGWRHPRPGAVIGIAIFALTLVLLYLTSTLYHALRPGRAKQLFLALDHSAIFLLIAGTYTPFTLGVLRGRWGWTLLILVWSIAIFGIWLKLVGRVHNTKVYVVLYVIMGWLALIAAKPILERIPLEGVFWILAGGFAYTIGLVFFGLDRIRYNHLLWHLFVLTGSVCHVFAVLWYAA